MPDNRNLHRNIFFRDCDKVPDNAIQRAGLQPPRGPMELDGHAAQGGQRAAGHLAQRQRERRLDVSRSTSTDYRTADRRRLGASRDRNERLVEIKQIKGQSETHPLLSPNDEFANYEIYPACSVCPPDVGRIDHIHGQLRPAGPERRHHHAGRPRLQPVQVRHGRWLRLAQHRQSLPPGQFLRWSRRCGRNRRETLGWGAYSAAL